LRKDEKAKNSKKIKQISLKRRKETNKSVDGRHRLANGSIKTVQTSGRVVCALFISFSFQIFFYLIFQIIYFSYEI